jgi:hypothetical protein
MEMTPGTMPGWRWCSMAAKRESIGYRRGHGRHAQAAARFSGLAAQFLQQHFVVAQHALRGGEHAFSLVREADVDAGALDDDDAEFGSSARRAFDSAGWVMWQAAAARPKCLCSLRATR